MTTDEAFEALRAAVESRPNVPFPAAEKARVEQLVRIAAALDGEHRRAVLTDEGAALARAVMFLTDPDIETHPYYAPLFELALALGNYVEGPQADKPDDGLCQRVEELESELHKLTSENEDLKQRLLKLSGALEELRKQLKTGNTPLQVVGNSLQRVFDELGKAGLTASAIASGATMLGVGIHADNASGASGGAFILTAGSLVALKAFTAATRRWFNRHRDDVSPETRDALARELEPVFDDEDEPPDRDDPESDPDVVEAFRTALVGGRLDDAKYLARQLTTLVSLDLRGTSVTDISPLSDLTALERLILTDTDVTDVSPLAGLTALEVLYLKDTSVTDVSPLAGLTALEGLYLRNTGVTDVSPLAVLTALETLDLDFTDVTDVSPLAGLTALEELHLRNTGVTDVSPLAGLTALETLILDGTGVTDVSPLAELTALKSLFLNDTGVTDVAPLAGLTALEVLNLTGTGMTDVSPLAGITALQWLDLDGTGVTDVSPLSGLTALERLDLTDTGVTDFGPIKALPKLHRVILPDGREIDPRDDGWPDDI